MRTIAAFVAAAAMLLQLILAAPLAMRMLASHGSTGWAAVLCSVRFTNGAANPTPVPGPPIYPHDHYSCPMCQSHGLGLAILVGGMLLFVAVPRLRRWPRAPVTTPAFVRPFRLYSSRAPPALA